MSPSDFWITFTFFTNLRIAIALANAAFSVIGFSVKYPENKQFP